MIVERTRQLASAVSPALWLLAFVGFISQVGIAVMLPLLPLYATELGAPPVVLGLLTSAFAVTNGIGQAVTGFLADRWGSRRWLSSGLGFYAAMNALIATATSATWLLLWRTMARFGGGALIVSERIYITEVTERARRAFANGIISAGQSAGAVAGPALGGLIAAIGGLRAPFVLVAATSTLAFVATLFLPGRPPREAETEPGADAPPGPLAYGPIAALLAANLAMMAGYGGFITTYGPLATQRLGWTIFDVGLAFSFFGIGSIVLGPGLAHLADRVGRRGVALVAIVPVSLFGGSLVLGLAQPVVYGIGLVAGGGLTAFNASWYALLADVSDERRRGRVFGVVSAVSNGGIVVGAMVAAQLWERIDLRVAMGSASVAILLAAVGLLAFRYPEHQQPVHV